MRYLRFAIVSMAALAAMPAGSQPTDQFQWLNGLSSQIGNCQQLGTRWELQDYDISVHPVTKDLMVRTPNGAVIQVPVPALVSGKNILPLAQMWWTKDARNTYYVVCYLGK